MDLVNLSVQDLINLRKFMELAKEAKKAYAIILDYYYYAKAFGLGKPVIQVYTYVENDGYDASAELSIDGKWHLHDNWGGERDFVVEVTEDGIYTIFREAYLEESGQNFTAKEPKLVASHQRSFVKQLEKMDKE